MLITSAADDIFVYIFWKKMWFGIPCKSADDSHEMPSLIFLLDIYNSSSIEVGVLVHFSSGSHHITIAYFWLGLPRFRLPKFRRPFSETRPPSVAQTSN